MKSLNKNAMAELGLYEIVLLYVPEKKTFILSNHRLDKYISLEDGALKIEGLFTLDIFNSGVDYGYYVIYKTQHLNHLFKEGVITQEEKEKNLDQLLKIASYIGQFNNNIQKSAAAQNLYATDIAELERKYNLTNISQGLIDTDIMLNKLEIKRYKDSIFNYFKYRKDLLTLHEQRLRKSEEYSRVTKKRNAELAEMQENFLLAFFSAKNENEKLLTLILECMNSIDFSNDTVNEES